MQPLARSVDNLTAELRMQCKIAPACAKRQRVNLPGVRQHGQQHAPLGLGTLTGCAGLLNRAPS